MSRVCRITPRVSRDIEAIADYLATQSGLDRAGRFLTGIDSTLQRTAQFPQIGRKRDEQYPSSRSLSYERAVPYFLSLAQDDIELLRAVSGYQDLTALFDGYP